MRLVKQRVQRVRQQAVRRIKQLVRRGAAAGASIPGADKKFATMVAQTDLAEIQVGNMALQKSNDPQVKQIAQKLVDDHTKTSTAMKEIAAKKGMTVPTETDSKHKALATKLQGESGKDFDKDFLAANSKDHHKVVAAFQKESTDGKDPDIKQFATQFLPAIQEHTTMIDQVSKGQGAGGTQVIRRSYAFLISGPGRLAPVAPNSAVRSLIPMILRRNK